MRLSTLNFVYSLFCLDLTLIEDIVEEKQESFLDTFWNGMIVFYLF